MKGINKIKLSVNQYLGSIVERKYGTYALRWGLLMDFKSAIDFELMKRCLADDIETKVLNEELTKIKKELKKLEKKREKYAKKIDKYGDKIEKLQANN